MPPRRSGSTPPAGDSDGGGYLHRHRIAGGIIAALVLLAVGQLVFLQVVRAPDLTRAASSQRTVTESEPATRGSILDRNGTPLAYTAQARSLSFQPKAVRARIAADHDKDPQQVADVATRLAEIAAGIVRILGPGAGVDEAGIRSKLDANEDFVYLVRSVSPQLAAQVTDAFPEVGAERQDIRIYPGGALAANVVGATGWEGNGLVGLESSLEQRLAGVDGSRKYDRGSDGAVIPGSERDVHPAVDGAKVELTLDSDLQWYVQQQVQSAREKSNARAASAVVLDAKTGEVLAMANDDTFDPSIGLGNNPKSARLGNPAVSDPFEPGSVNKIIAASGAIEYGITNPNQVWQVPGSIDMAGVNVKDAWEHGTVPYTTTGIFGKSSNVGTLMLSDRLGKQRYAELLAKFGLGRRTDVGLPAESAGRVPALSQWAAGTFANLPIGQGLSMTLLQMTGLYQAIANDGVRVPPRIIRSVTAADGTVTRTPRPETVQVVSPQTAKTVRDMFRSVVQSGPGEQSGTGPQAAIEGYQVSGKTGTAQQIDEKCACYSNSNYNITFAGIAPADDPRFVIGIMLDRPTRSSDGSGGQSAAPLFHTIGSWLLNRDNVPQSKRPAPVLTLQAG